MKTNLTCEACERELTAYVDGQLHRSVARVIEDHATSCARCGASLAIHRAIAAHARRLPSVEAPAWLEDRVVRTVTRPARLRALWTRTGAIAASISFAVTVGGIAFWPRLAKAFGLPDPATWLVHAVETGLDVAIGAPKRLALDLAFYEPIARQVWLAVRSLSDIPRVVILALRTPDAMWTGAILLTLGVAFYWILRPSRTHEGGIGHACLAL
ncbi:MAG TPA: hypothetical protein VF363_06605 [Candidatus Eisenbacteria bacterium]